MKVEEYDLVSPSNINAVQIVASTLGVPLAKLPKDAGIGTMDEWDSLTHMRIIMGLEEALKTTLPLETIMEISNLSDIERVAAEFCGTANRP